MRRSPLGSTPSRSIRRTNPPKWTADEEALLVSRLGPAGSPACTNWDILAAETFPLRSPKALKSRWAILRTRAGGGSTGRLTSRASSIESFPSPPPPPPSPPNEPSPSRYPAYKISSPDFHLPAPAQTPSTVPASWSDAPPSSPHDPWIPPAPATPQRLRTPELEWMPPEPDELRKFAYLMWPRTPKKCRDDLDERIETLDAKLDILLSAFSEYPTVLFVPPTPWTPSDDAHLLSLASTDLIDWDTIGPLLPISHTISDCWERLHILRRRPPESSSQLRPSSQPQLDRIANGLDPKLLPDAVTGAAIVSGERLVVKGGAIVSPSQSHDHRWGVVPAEVFLVSQQDGGLNLGVEEEREESSSEGGWDEGGVWQGFE